MNTIVSSKKASAANKEARQDTLIFGGCLAADALSGDGLKDHIPETLRAAVEHLHRDGEVGFDQVRDALQEHLASGPASVAGYVHKLQGQIGEDLFIAERPEFKLSDSGSQEAFDAWRETDGGGIEAVQIKTWEDADGMVEALAAARAKAADGLEIDGHGVDGVAVAVPSDIAESVRARLASHVETDDISVIPFEGSAESAADVVESAFDAVSAPAEHAAGELFDFISSALAVTAAAEALRVLVGEKSPEQAGAVIAEKAAVVAVASVAAGAASLIFGGALIPVGVGMFVRYKLHQLTRDSSAHPAKRPLPRAGVGSYGW